MQSNGLQRNITGTTQTYRFLCDLARKFTAKFNCCEPEDKKER